MVTTSWSQGRHGSKRAMEYCQKRMLEDGGAYQTQMAIYCECRAMHEEDFLQLAARGSGGRKSRNFDQKGTQTEKRGPISMNP